MRMKSSCLIAVSLLACLSAHPILAGEKNVETRAEMYLTSGRLKDGEAQLTRQLLNAKLTGMERDNLRFGLGVIQFLRAVEWLGQTLYGYGLENRSLFLQNQMPFLRFPVPKNPNSDSVDAGKLRKMFERFLADLRRTEATLAEIKSKDVKLHVNLDKVLLDINGDGLTHPIENLRNIYKNYVTNVYIGDVDFDKADVHWLRGYCHLLMALDEVILAYDWDDVINRSGHLFFPKLESPHSIVLKKQSEWLIDEIAFVHQINFKVRDPKRMRSALHHLNQVIVQSRQTWKEISLETDDEEEWIPGPHQKGAIAQLNITREMVSGWHEFLDEAELILAGKKLIPHPRLKKGFGINVRKVFTQPANYDLVLWYQGSGIVPFVEEGKLTDPILWGRLENIFRGNFIGFAVWFN